MTLVVSCSEICLLKAADAPSSNPASADDGWISLLDEKNNDRWCGCLDSSGRNDDLHCVFKLNDGRIPGLDVPMSDGESKNGYLATWLPTRTYTS
jgi:hypothetical protein